MTGGLTVGGGGVDRGVDSLGGGGVDSCMHARCVFARGCRGGEGGKLSADHVRMFGQEGGGFREEGPPPLLLHTLQPPPPLHLRASLRV